MSTAPIHALGIAEVFNTLESTPAGLTPEQAQARLALYGPNSLREPPPVPAWRRLVTHLTQMMALLLWAAAALAFLGGRPVLGLVIGLVVLVNAGFSFWQEYRAERAVSALKHILPASARVVRAERESQLPADGLVPGDVLVLSQGDNIPADARVVEAYGLRVNQATLTGEAWPALKTAEGSLREGLSELERPNLIFAGTSIVSGTGRAVVVATGMLTQFGRITDLTQHLEEPPSPLQQSMARVTRRMAYIALGLGAVVFIAASLDAGIPRFEAFVLAVGLIVATVPVGLNPTITLSLAMAVQRLAQRGVLVKKLATVETLGTTSVICTDKSGTLTQNQMTVRGVWLAGQRLTVSGVGYEPVGVFAPTPAGALAADLDSLLTAATLCNNARLTPPSPEQPRWASLGDQTEAALRVLALKGGIDELALARDYPRVHELPFDARRKRMSTVHACQNASAGQRLNGQRRTPTGRTDPLARQAPLVSFVKGAPREVLQLCTRILVAGEILPLDETMRAEIDAAIDDYARNALRVLALARSDLPAPVAEPAGPAGRQYAPDRIERDLTFLGLVAMMDPPRPEVAEAVAKSREAGIRLVMITGDYGLTAESIARRVGIVTSPSPRILTGAELDGLSDAELQAALIEEVICARMAPEHKLRLVAAFQARGDIVAMLGDGVNDAPALRKADIGLAMGVTGTDVAKEAADVILTNDNFAVLISAIEEGRAVYDNLRKFITYIFASNVPELVPVVVAALFHVPLALTVTQILAIDLGTDLLPALALSTEKPEPNVMRRPPRRRDQPLLDVKLLARSFLWLGVLEAGLCYVGFFAVYYLAGYRDLLHLPRLDWLPYAERLAAPGGEVFILATTVFHAGVVAAQIGNAFACRTEKAPVHRLGWFSNRFLLVGIAVEICLILLLIYVRPLAALFEHLPLPPIYWLGLGLYAPVLFGVERMRKVIARRLDRSRERRRATAHPAGGMP